VPGYSEHHAGFAFDFGLWRGGQMAAFLGTGVHSWFSQNAHYFGFILRYPENRYSITRTAFEPWHFRYVGVPHAQIIVSSGFVLEEYIEFLRIRGQHYSYTIYIDDILYEIFFTRDLVIELPAYSEYRISGNNIDGFVVTITHRPDNTESDIPALNQQYQQYNFAYDTYTHNTYTENYSDY
jgi:D-alanyl-D-alanine carboxypeptidase